MNKISYYFASEFNNSRSQIYLLIDKILQSNNKVSLYCENELTEIIDKEIWTFSQQKFIPHLKYKEISSDFESDNTNLIIFDELIMLDSEKFRKVNFLIIINPSSEKYRSFIEEAVKENKNLNILIFFFKNYEDEIKKELLDNCENKIFSMTEEKIWKEIKN